MGSRWRRHGVQEGHHVGANEGVQRADPGARHSKRDQGGLFANRFRALWSICMPHLKARVENGQRDRWKENGRPTFLEVQRDGRVLLPATAAISVRLLQELRGPLARCFHGWKWRCYVGQSRELRKEGGGRKGR